MLLMVSDRQVFPRIVIGEVPWIRRLLVVLKLALEQAPSEWRYQRYPRRRRIQGSLVQGAIESVVARAETRAHRDTDLTVRVTSNASALGAQVRPRPSPLTP